MDAVEIDVSGVITPATEPQLADDLRGGADPSRDAYSEVPGWHDPGTSMSGTSSARTGDDERVRRSGCTASTGSPHSCTRRTCILPGSWRSRRGSQAPSRWGRVGS